MKRLALFTALLALIWSAAPLVQAAETNPQECWLLQEGHWGEFTIKFYLTGHNQDVLSAEKLKRRHPEGLYGRPADISPETRRRMAIRNKPYQIHMEIWRQGLVDLFARPGLIIAYPDFSKAVIQQNDYPTPGCTSQTLYIDVQGPGASGLKGRNVMMTVCPREERLTAYWLDCADEDLYGWVAGDPNDEFARTEGVKGTPPLRHVCDRSLERFGGKAKSRQVITSPIRRLTFDETEKGWRTDHPGEFPRFYFNQITLVLNRFGLSFKTAPPVRANKNEIETSGKALMEEIMAGKDIFIEKANRELPFVTYCLAMMGVPKKEVKKFFVSLAADYVKARGPLDLGSEKPEQIFESIAASGRQFQPIEKDILYR